MDFIILFFICVAATLALLNKDSLLAGFHREEHSDTFPFYVDVSKEKMIWKVMRLM